MAWTQSDLDALEAAIASGARVVEYDGRSTTFQSLADMLQLRRMMRAELGITPLNARTFTLASYRKGTARDD